MHHMLAIASVFFAMVCAPALVSLKVNKSLEQDLDCD